MGAVALMMFASCSDTWDEHYNGSEAASASKTLWEQIEAKPELSRFAAIAAKAIYYKDDLHPLTNPTTGKPYTFKDKFSETMPMTVWAPTNDAISEADMQEWLQLVDKQPYAVHQQLMANSIALNRIVANNEGVDSLLMLNGKRMVFDKKNLTMQDMPIVDYNIPASNGTLHTLKQKIPFEYNLYEYVKEYENASANNVLRFHQYVLQTDTVIFQQNASIEGNPDANGNPTYVDSAYTYTNLMFHSRLNLPRTGQDKCLTYREYFDANIAGEDSDFILVMPTDAAWEAAYEKLKPLYNYAPIYLDNDKGNSGTIAYREISEEGLDSLTNQSINMDIVSPLCFNAHLQPKLSLSAPVWNSDKLLAAPDASLKYLLNTYGDTLRTDDNWVKTDMWAGKKAIKMSNGYGLMTDNWDIPRKLYYPDVTVEIGWGSFYNVAASTSSATSISFSSSKAEAWADTVGYVSHDNFYDIEPNSPTGSINHVFRLVGNDGENRESEVMSGTYDICLVVVPDFYATSGDTIVGDTIQHKIYATLNYCNGSPDGKDAKLKIDKKDAITYTGEKVDTIVLFKDFTFPYSYKNLRYSYPTLEISTTSSSNERDEKKTHPVFKNNLCIDRILLIAKDGKKDDTED